MQLIYHILALAALITALPSERQQIDRPQQIGSDGALTTSGQCQKGEHYCFSQIIGDLGVSKQNILHQYCDQKYTTDWQSCNRCKRPWPLPECWDGPGAWKSVFECVDDGKYEWVGRCEGEGTACGAGTCQSVTVDGADHLTLVGHFTPKAT